MKSFLIDNLSIMNNLKYAIGIDVSMKDFVCCLSVISDQQEVKVKASHKFTNSASGFQSLLEGVKKHSKEQLPIVYVMEAMPGQTRTDRGTARTIRRSPAPTAQMP